MQQGMSWEADKHFLYHWTKSWWYGVSDIPDVSPEDVIFSLDQLVVSQIIWPFEIETKGGATAYLQSLAQYAYSSRVSCLFLIKAIGNEVVG